MSMWKSCDDEYEGNEKYFKSKSLHGDRIFKHFWIVGHFSDSFFVALREEKSL